MADYHVKTTAAGGGDGSSGNPWTLQEAFDSALAGDRVFIWDGTYTLSATVDIDTRAGTAASPIQFIGANASGTEDGTRPVITTSSTLSNGLLRNGGSSITHLQFRHLDLNGGGASKAAYCVNQDGSNSSDYWTFIDCLFHAATSHGISGRASIRLVRCALYSNSGCGYALYSTGGSKIRMIACRVNNNGSHGVYCGADELLFDRCLIYANTGKGIYHDSGGYGAYCSFTFNTIYGNTSDGISFGGGMAVPEIVGNILASNGGYGLNCGGSWKGGVFEWNVLNGNTSGGCDVTIPGNYYGVTTAPSFQDTGAGTEDLTPTDGSNADATGPAPSTNTELDIGAVSAAEPAGGGGGLLTHPGMSGGFRG